MALVSNQFRGVPELEAAAKFDKDHILQGTRGEHVRKIQNALNRLSAGQGRANFNLKEDGIYGPKTAAAVKAYKNNHKPDQIVRPGQKTADDIVGIRTMKALDDEMDILENELPLLGGLISSTPGGAPHDHKRCPGPPRVTGDLFEGRASHLGTPIHPKSFGRKINIFGEGETDYLGFTDFSTEQKFQAGRPLTQTLPSASCSDICMRSSPINRITHGEIKRLARPMALGGCRFTYASNQVTFAPPKPLIESLGLVIQQARLAHEGHEKDPDFDMECWVVEIRK